MRKSKSELNKKISSKILKDLEELDKILSEICDEKEIKNSKQTEYDMNQCKCDECGKIFTSDYQFNKHACDKEDNKDDVDNIPTNIFGQYEPQRSRCNNYP